MFRLTATSMLLLVYFSAAASVANAQSFCGSTPRGHSAAPTCTTVSSGCGAVSSCCSATKRILSCFKPTIKASCSCRKTTCHKCVTSCRKEEPKKVIIHVRTARVQPVATLQTVMVPQYRTVLVPQVQTVLVPHTVLSIHACAASGVRSVVTGAGVRYLSACDLQAAAPALKSTKSNAPRTASPAASAARSAPASDRLYWLEKRVEDLEAAVNLLQNPQN